MERFLAAFCAEIVGMLHSFSVLLSILQFHPDGYVDGGMRATPEIILTGGGPAVANTARDGNIAIREEYDDAIAKGTAEALEVFIARHPDHSLARLARAELAKIKPHE